MPSILILPNGTYGTNNWQCSTGSDFVDIVDEDDDSTYIYERTRNGIIQYTMANPSLLEEAIDWNEDVTLQARIFAYYTDSGKTCDMEIDLIGPAGSSINIPSSTVAVTDNNTYPPYGGTSTTVMHDTTPWDYNGIEDVIVRLKCIGRPARFTELRVSYVYIRMSYTEAAVAVADNSTFFGANF
jgi:hypothetical protein